MNTFRVLPLLLALLPALAQAQTEPAKPAKPATPAATQPPLLPNQQAFLNLPEERRKEFAKQLGEAFVTKKWQECHDLFLKIFKAIPKENIALSRLVEFKILLCKKKLGLKEEAIAMANKYDIDDDSPYYCFAQAAIAYDEKDLVKAEEWLARASRIFKNAEALAPWQDTLVEFGYIKSFYGGDLKDE